MLNYILNKKENLFNHYSELINLNLINNYCYVWSETYKFYMSLVWWMSYCIEIIADSSEF